MTETRRPLRVLLLTHRLPSPRSGIGIRVRSLLRALPADTCRLTVVALHHPEEERPADSAESLGAAVEQLVIIPAAGASGAANQVTRPPSPAARVLRSARWRVKRVTRALRWSPPDALPLPGSIRYFAREYRGITARLDELARTSGPYDLVDLDELIAYLLPRSLWGLPKVASFAGIMADIMESELRARGEQKDLRLELDAMRRYERGVADACDVSVSVCEEDVQSLTRANPRTRIFMVRNAIDEGYYAAWTPRPVEPNKLVFTGSMSYSPNVDAVAMMADELIPRLARQAPAAWFEIVGGDPSPDVVRRQSPKLVVRGAVDDMRDYIGTAAVVVAPLRFGGGTKMKVLEGMAMGRPVVSTSIGCEGLDVVDGEHALIANDADGLVAAIVRLLSDPTLARRVGEAGRALVAGKYSARQSAQALTQAYEAVTRLDSHRVATLARAARYGWKTRLIRRVQ